jgi:hypothetical protein
MPYPALVPPTGKGFDLGWSPHGVLGFEYLGNQYAFIRQGAEFLFGDFKIHVMKSTDLGLTWSDKASVTIPPSDPPTDAVGAYTVCKDGSLVYLMAVDTLGVNSGALVCGPVYLWVYDLSTDTFTSGPVVPAGAPTVNKFWHGGAVSTNGNVGISLLRRAAGDMVLLYPGSPEVVSALTWARVSAIAFDGSAFGVSAELAGQSGTAAWYAPCGAEIDASGILHVILDSRSLGGGSFFYHIGLSSTGSFGTLTAVESAPFFNHLGPAEDASNLLLFSNNGTPSIGFLGVQQDASPNGALLLYYAPSGQLTPAWSSVALAPVEPVVIGNGANGGALATALQHINGILAAFWTVSGTAPDWDTRDGLGHIQFTYTLESDITGWHPDASLFATTETTFCAVQVIAWPGLSLGFGVLGDFILSGGDFDEQTMFSVFAPISLTYDNLPGVVGTPYSDSLVAAGGTPPYVLYELISGSLPPGLTLTGPLIHGTPTTPGTYPFTARVTDSVGGTATVIASITISSTSGTVTIQLIGWKLYRDEPCEPMQAAKEIPSPDWWK